MKRRVLSYLAAAGFALLSSQTFANSVFLTGFSYGPATISTIQSAAPGTLISPFTVYAGQYSGILDGKSFLTYCAEITQYLYFNTLYTDYTVVSGATAWGAAKSAVLDRMISALLGANINSSPDGSGLVQAAIWEVLYETAPAYAFASGSFNVASSNNMQIKRSSIDWLALEAAPVRYSVDLLYSPTAQDLLLITPKAVPEPSSYALMLVGLAGLGFAARRRSLRR